MISEKQTISASLISTRRLKTKKLTLIPFVIRQEPSRLFYLGPLVGPIVREPVEEAGLADDSFGPGSVVDLKATVKRMLSSQPNGPIPIGTRM